MLIRCPQCREPNRLSEVQPHRRVFSYLCANCERIVRIDLALDALQSAAASASFDKPQRSRSVLVADDSAASGEVIAGILRDDGYRVRIVHDGEEALAAIRHDHPDLAVIDLLLPVISGVDIVRAVRSDPRLATIPVIVIGSVMKPDVVHYLKELGAAGFVDRDQLVNSLVFRARTALSAPGLTRRRAGLET